MTHWVTLLTAPHISLINAAAYVHTCKLEGSLQFQLQLCPEDSVKAQSSTTSSPLDKSSVPKEYHDYANIFSKVNTFTLPPHCDYDLKIKLEKEATSPLGTIYSLSLVELPLSRLSLTRILPPVLFDPPLPLMLLWSSLSRGRMVHSGSM